MMRKVLALVISITAAAIGATSVMAHGVTQNHASYTWIVGFLPPGSADTAKAPDGSTITMKGSGTLMAGPESTATGGGTYTKSSGETGTWVATALDGFVSYGPGTLIPLSNGGEAKLRVTLSNGQTGTLTIFCVAPGSSPPPSKMEGIQLILGSGVSGEYTTPDGGNTVFLSS